MFKKALFAFFGVAIAFIIGSVIMVPINTWFADTYLGGEDHTGQIARFNMFILWPTFIAAGFFLGNYTYKKYLTLKSRGQQGPGQ